MTYDYQEGQTGDAFHIHIPVTAGQGVHCHLLAQRCDSDRRHQGDRVIGDVFSAVSRRLDVKQRVLLVDDAALGLTILARLLNPYFDVVVKSENGSLAVEAMEHSIESLEPFDLVLMDYQMPVMDGPTSAREMRVMGYKGPIIGVTGNTLHHHVDTFMAHGVDAVLFKPLRLGILMETIRGTITTLFYLSM